MNGTVTAQGLRLPDFEIGIFYQLETEPDGIHIADVLLHIRPDMQRATPEIGVEEFLGLSAKPFHPSGLAGALQMRLNQMRSESFVLTNVRPVYIHRRSSKKNLETGRLVRLRVIEPEGRTEWLAHFFLTLEDALVEFFTVGIYRAGTCIPEPTKGPLKESFLEWYLVQLDELDDTPHMDDFELIG